MCHYVYHVRRCARCNKQLGYPAGTGYWRRTVAKCPAKAAARGDKAFHRETIRENTAEYVDEFPSYCRDCANQIAMGG